jgi:ABC-type glycerol-3-phosphate transport system substrate-binding protein
MQCRLMPMLACLVVMSLVLAAGTAVLVPADTALAADPVPAAAEKVQIVYWGIADGTEILEKPPTLIDEFNASHTDIEVLVETAPYQQHYDRVVTAFAAGALPDVIRVPNVNAGKAWAAGGMLLPLDEYIAASSIKAEDYFEAAWLPGVLDGVVYGIPQSIDTRGLGYNIDLFTKEKLQLPTNWDEFLAVAKALTKDTDGDGAIDQYGFTPECGGGGGCLVYDFGMFVVGNNGYIVSPDGTECWANKKEAVEALEYWVELNPYILKGWWEMSNEMDTLFAQGKVAMQVSGPWKMTSIPGINPDMVLGKNFDIAPFPGSGHEGAPPYAGTMGGWMWSIASTSKHPAEAWKFIEWMQDPKRIARHTDALPVSKAAAGEPRWEAKQYVEVYVPKALPYSRPPAGLSPAVLEIYELEANAVQSAVLGEKTPQQAMDDLCKDVNPLLAETAQ